MAAKHEQWRSVNAKTGLLEWERLTELADGTRTTGGIAEILNYEYSDIRDPKTTGAVRKKLTRMDLPWRRPGEELPIEIIAPSWSPHIITEPRVRDDKDKRVFHDTTALAVGCLHAPYHDVEIINLVLKFANNKLKPDEVYLNGDIFDLYTISKFSKRRERKIQWSMWDEVKASIHVKEAFENIEGVSRTWFNGGNHEDRLRRYLMDRAPELMSFPFLSIPELFKVDYRNYYDYHEHQKHVRNNLMIAHGDVIRVHSGYTAKAHVEKYGMSVLHNHSHRGGSYYVRRYGQQLRGEENFCLCDLEPEYTVHPNWQQGFSVIFFSGNGKRFHIVPVPIAGGGFMWEGERWSVKDLKPEDMRVF